MPTKTSISPQKEDHAPAKAPVGDGRVPPAGAVVQHGPEIFSARTADDSANRATLRALSTERAAGPVRGRGGQAGSAAGMTGAADWPAVLAAGAAADRAVNKDNIVRASCAPAWRAACWISRPAPLDMALLRAEDRGAA